VRAFFQSASLEQQKQSIEMNQLYASGLPKFRWVSVADNS
jgi:hypothetical protein